MMIFRVAEVRRVWGGGGGGGGGGPNGGMPRGYVVSDWEQEVVGLWVF